jgi:hypothetical protein
MRKDKIFKQDGKLVYHKQTDATASLEAVKMAREAPATPLADSVHVGRIDAHVLEMWLQEAGVKMHERDKVREVVRKKLLSGDFAKFRVWEGTF